MHNPQRTYTESELEHGSKEFSVFYSALQNHTSKTTLRIKTEMRAVEALLNDVNRSQHMRLVKTKLMETIRDLTSRMPREDWPLFQSDPLTILLLVQLVRLMITFLLIIHRS